MTAAGAAEPAGRPDPYAERLKCPCGVLALRQAGPCPCGRLVRDTP